MEASGASNQLEAIKQALVKTLISECTRLGERFYFTRPVLFIYNNNPLSVCNVYGIENNVLLFDTPDPNLRLLDHYSIPVEGLVLIKQEVENTLKVKDITSKF